MRITLTSLLGRNLSHLAVVSTAVAVWIAQALPGSAHEVLPAIADMEQDGDTLHFDIRLGIESFIAGIDLTAVSDTNEAPEAAVYDELRALEPAALEDRFATFWPEMQTRVQVIVDGTPVTIENPEIEIGAVGNIEAVRETALSFSAPLPSGASEVQVGWDPAFGTLVIRQQGVEDPYDGYLEAGALTDPIPLNKGKSWWRRLFD